MTIHSEWQVTVQKPQVPGGRGYIQIDDISGGENRWSKSPETLAKEGYEVPDFSALPQGKYTVKQAMEILGPPPG